MPHCFYSRIILVLLFIYPVASSAGDYSVDAVIKLEQRLNTLIADIYVTKKPTFKYNLNHNMALYHLKKHNWKKSFAAILQDESETDSDDISYAYILYGISLQGLKKKRGAFYYFARVPADSRYYATAQLNIALLYMHDGLINKAISVLDKLATDSEISNSTVKNRLFTTLGYLYYKVKNFILARQTFRQVTSRNLYTNKALLGLALSDLELNNFNAAQNILLFLIRQKSYDLPADESFLTLAFSYESQKKYDRATLAYQNAISHYQKRIKNISELLYQDTPININSIKNRYAFVLSDTTVNLLDKLPADFFDNYLLLKQLLNTLHTRIKLETSLHHRAEILYADYNKLINKLLVNKLLIRKKHLLDYLNQSKYGLTIANDKFTSQK